MRHRLFVKYLHSSPPWRSRAGPTDLGMYGRVDYLRLSSTLASRCLYRSDTERWTRSFYNVARYIAALADRIAYLRPRLPPKKLLFSQQALEDYLENPQMTFGPFGFALPAPQGPR